MAENPKDFGPDKVGRVQLRTAAWYSKNPGALYKIWSNITRGKYAVMSNPEDWPQFCSDLAEAYGLEYGQKHLERVEGATKLASKRIYPQHDSSHLHMVPFWDNYTLYNIMYCFDFMVVYDLWEVQDGSRPVPQST